MSSRSSTPATQSVRGWAPMKMKSADAFTVSVCPVAALAIAIVSSLPSPRTSLTLEFEAPDVETFPMLRLAREAGERAGTSPCVFNAANEVAVAAFLDGRLPFLGIADVVADALSRADGAPARDLDDLIELDRSARALADERLAVA